MKHIVIKKNNGSINKRSILILVIVSTLILTTYVGIRYWRSSQEYNQSASTQAPEIVPGEIVTLKRMKEEYFLDFHNMWSNKVRQGIEYPQNIPLRYTISYLKHQMASDQYHDKKKLWYVIFDNKDEKLIGALEIRNFEPDDVGQFGCWVNENYWGGGRFVEAGKLIAKTYLDMHPKIDSFIAHVRLWNKRSYHGLKKVGFQDHDFFYENGEKTRHILKFYRNK